MNDDDQDRSGTERQQGPIAKQPATRGELVKVYAVFGGWARGTLGSAGLVFGFTIGLVTPELRSTKVTTCETKLLYVALVLLMLSMLSGLAVALEMSTRVAWLTMKPDAEVTERDLRHANRRQLLAQFGIWSFMVGVVALTWFAALRLPDSS